LPAACVRDLIEMFRPIREKCIGLLVGNHEESQRIKFSNDVHKAMCIGLGVKDLGYNSLIRWSFVEKRPGGEVRKRPKYPSANAPVLKMLASHGTIASRKDGAKINRMADEAAQFDVDIALFGHGHSKLVAERVQLDIPSSGAIRLIERKKIVVMTGTYRRNHTIGTRDYAEKAGYPPVPIGSPKVKINPFLEPRYRFAVEIG